MRIGAHVPVADGLIVACAYAADAGCECMQVFAKSPRQWHGPRRSDAEAAAFRQERSRLGLEPLYTHAAYLINLGSDDPLLWERSWRALADEIVRAAQLGADGVVVHAGTTYAGAHATPAGRVGEAVARAYATAVVEWDVGRTGPAGPTSTDGAAEARGHVPPVLLENAAGAGRSFGSRLEDLCRATSLAAEQGADVGVCFDACHGFAAGIDIARPGGWPGVCDAVEAGIGMDRLLLVHANDCAGALGARRDRHAWIGDGEVGTDGFAAMFAEPRLTGAACVVEMPGDPPEKDRINVRRLRTLRDGASAGGAPGPGPA